MVNLVRKPNEWLVSHVVKSEVVHERFITIEQAADFMMRLGVLDLEIDEALCCMYGYEHNRALFNKNGEFSHSEVS